MTLNTQPAWPPANQAQFRRYIRIINWAALRYRDATGRLVVSCSDGSSVYERIERAAWAKYAEPTSIRTSRASGLEA